MIKVTTIMLKKTMMTILAINVGIKKVKITLT